MIAARLAFVRLHQSRYDEARALAERAIGALPPGDAEIAGAQLTAGNAARFSFDFPAAIAFYRRALDVAKGSDDDEALNARVGLAYAQTTIDPVVVGAELDRILADKAGLAKRDKKDIAVIEDLRARAAMNAGDSVTARRMVERALSDSGGLSVRVSLSQVAIRNDAAIISSLRHDDDDTRKYLAYTGAGHLPQMDWIGQHDGELPVCGDLADIRPADTVIIQFSVADDGHVDGALPIYASRPGMLGAVFAQAVSQWHWNQQSLKGVEPFWRNSLVLQLRCETRPSPKGLAEPVTKRMHDWLASKGVELAPDKLEASAAPDDPHLQVNDASAIPAMFARLRSHHDSGGQWTAQLRATLDANHAPPAAYALLIAIQASQHGARAYSLSGAAAATAGFYAVAVPPFSTQYPNDLSTAWLLLQWALSLEDAGLFKSAQPLLKAVTDTPEAVLSSDSPIRSVALLHSALVANRLGDAPSAQADLARSGLDAGQCSLFDTHPIPASVAIGSAQFPSEAMRWHFEGYVEESYDIADDGHVANIRTIFAYPPFVFGPDTEQAVRSFRYIPPKIGSKSVGCTGETQAVRYKIPS